MVLEHLEPKKAFAFFEEMCQIPHGSGNEKAISDYFVKFAKDRNLSVNQDAFFNVLIKKPGSKGRENDEPVILQGHIDMVCEKNAATRHDFEKDPLALRICPASTPTAEMPSERCAPQPDSEGFIMATGTTLGADNGAAVAMLAAILDSDDIAHPPLEVVLTTSEEVGMEGAEAFDASLLSGTRFINLDSEEEGVFTVSCAGGLRITLQLEAEFESLPPGYTSRVMGVRGLLGGHSGMEIIEERANANRLVARLLNKLSREHDVYFHDINGGAQDNAIPRECAVVVSFREDDLEAVFAAVSACEETFRREFRANEKGLELYIEQTAAKAEKVFTRETARKTIAAILLCPNGIQAMNLDVKGIVETSNNVGVVRTLEDGVHVTSAVRSSVASRKYFVAEQIALLADTIGAKAVIRSDYPAWEYIENSPLRDTAVDVYKEMFHKEPVIAAIHAGLECGLFAEKMKGVDMISFGPDMFGIHTPDERLSIASFKRTWVFLLEVLARL